MTYDRSPEFDDNRSAERWTEKLEAWAARLDAAKYDADKLESLCAVLDEEVGQNEAWVAVCDYATSLALGYDGDLPRLLTAARDAILATGGE